jgi:predicted membrane-bound spermidine synthase
MTTTFRGAAMTPEQIGDAVVALAIISGYLLILGVGCLIADFVFPHIPFIERYLESLPDWDDEEDC